MAARTAGEQPAQQYVVFDAEKLVGKSLAEQALTPDIIDKHLRPLLQKTAGEARLPFSHDDYKIEAVPLLTFHPGDPRPAKLPPFTPQEVFSVSSPSTEAANRFRAVVLASIRGGAGPLRSLGVNPAMGVGEYSVPVAPDGAVFGTLADARRLIGADLLPPNLNGQSVNVVVIDTGIDLSIVPPGQFGGGWQPQAADPTLPTPPLPGMTTGTDALHGMMIVNNILAMAPAATIFDVPLIPPPKIFDIFNFLVAAEAAYQKILQDILWFQANGMFTGPWLFMNAWAIYDRRSEGAYLGEYTENLGIGGIPPHPFIQRIQDVASHNFDIVFCAGNCGEVCPDDRCGPNDYGPGRSIWGANAHREVLTAGAVRVDEIWPGYSSEGPGPTPNLYAQKPDLCAPAQFVGTSGQYPPNTGTSTSAAVAAGIVCALRSRANWNQTTVPPFILKLILNNTALQTLGPGWNRWLGNGILNVGAAYLQLLASFP
jgi:hypothetical protein